MCLILFAWQHHPRYRLVLAANRDERHDRATDAAQWWPDAPDLFAGRDQVAGGTWLGITRQGRIAALTNHRDLRRAPRQAESRGHLVRDFLLGEDNAPAFLERVATEQQRWLPFNLLVGDGDTLACFGSEAAAGEQVQTVTPGLHGLSNHLLDTPWPKVRWGRAALAGALEAPDAELEAALFGLLADRSTASGQELPDTGLPIDRERAISAPMIIDPIYGTRCATVLLVEHDGRLQLRERSFDPSGRVTGEVAAASRPARS